MAKNAYAKRLDAARAAREYAIRRYTRQQMLDFVTIALGRMGYGEKRLKDFEKMLSAVYIEFAESFTSGGTPSVTLSAAVKTAYTVAIAINTAQIIVRMIDRRLSFIIQFPNQMLRYRLFTNIFQRPAFAIDTSITRGDNAFDIH